MNQMLPSIDADVPELSIVIPMMNEAQALQSLFDRITDIMRQSQLHYEIVCVNDGSTDGTIAALLELQAARPEIVVIDLSRNFGKEAALTAGLFEARGRSVIPLDADLQDPPELIPLMVEKWRNGAEVVLAIRERRDTDTHFKRTSANLFYRLINQLSDIIIPAHAGDFRLMDRQVIEALRTLPERTRFNKGLFAWLGFRAEVVHYARPTRQAGTSKWAYRRLWSLALDGITSFSSLPLRIWSYLGVAIAAGALVYGVVIVIRAMFFNSIGVPGYASLMTVVLFSCGLTLIGLGVIGEYLSRVFIEVKQRPLFIVRRVHRAPHQARASSGSSPGE